MMRINLLPYREEKRKARRQRFFVMLGLASALACVIVFIAFTGIDEYISTQDQRNALLKNEIVTLDKQIEEIKKLQEKTQALLARKQIIEALQRDRTEAVRLLSEITKQVPEGVYLRSLKQDEAKVVLTGYAQSNARVSTLMRNIEASPWLENPVLIEIKAAMLDKRRINDFQMTVDLKRSTLDEGKKK